VRKTLLKTLGISAAAVALALFGYAAQAQAPKKEEPKAAAKKPAKPPACNTLKAQAACEGREDCRWVAASIDEKTKKQKKAAYCQAKPKAPAKKEPAKKEPAKK
jgi:hypothetical protein